MGLKEKMMEEKTSKISPEERKEMMSKMMSAGGGMMGMIATTMGGRKGSEGDFNPMEMCKRMMFSITQTGEIASFANPEVRGLFEEWAQQIEEEILSFIKEKESIHPEEIAAHLKISKENVHYFLSRLAQKGKIQFKVEPEKSPA